MFKHLFALVWYYNQSAWSFFLTVLFLACSPFARAGEYREIPKAMPHLSPVISSVSSTAAFDSTTELDQTNQDTVQLDPLNSPHPIPWSWVMNTYTELSQKGNSGLRYYRSSSLVSPDGKYAAYSRIKMQAEPDLYRSRISSVMFLENLQTGDLQTVTAASPLADNPFAPNEDADQPGAMAILLPVSWSETGDRILARQFEGFLSTSDASDYAVVWHRKNNHTDTLSPSQVEYTNAVLLGWSQTEPNNVLFRAGNLGEEEWFTWSVNPQNGETALANEDQPIVYGSLKPQIWTGPQARW